MNENERTPSNDNINSNYDHNRRNRDETMEKLQGLVEQYIDQYFQRQPNASNILNHPPPSSTQIGLQDAIRLLPYSFDGRDVEQLEIFLEKCEFAVECVVPAAVPRLLQAIQTKLTGKARQITKFKPFESWEDLRDALKSNLEPQRTTPHLYLELYATKQLPGEDILTYSMKVEKLQNQIVEQETCDQPVEVAQAIERTIQNQVIQVFMEGLGSLKDFIKARNPKSLEKAIQVAREEERIRNSNLGARQFLKPSTSVPSNSSQSCHSCGRKGHFSKFCPQNPSTSTGKGKPQKPSIPNPNSTAPVCRYCKNEGHVIEDCIKRRYANSKNNRQNSENTKRPVQSARPAGQLQAAIVQLGESTHAPPS
ncbi:uncharacterized protein LOC126844000 [Adelges cooleyi]|uniref:uncharacterized protein LOC126844000 n=1 Tax=Adelges cooleyi TaxID=133065 RepID=UPI00217FDE59|nr:uncharacterized protein LOC126844000 [Adelges cooleyi]